jgi:hypothetical protein
VTLEKWGIYRAPSQAAARQEEQLEMRRGDGWERDPCDGREKKRQPSDHRNTDLLPLGALEQESKCPRQSRDWF